jgi:hypothetical protein
MKNMSMVDLRYLAKVQPEMNLYQLHISYFLQNCNKGKPRKWDLPLLKNDITDFERTVKMLDTLQKHVIGIRYMFVGYHKFHTAQPV